MNADKHIVCILLLIISFGGVAQKNKSQLQAERQQNQQKIKEVEKILGETTSQKKNTIGELSALNEQIQAQESLIISIRSEIDFLNKEIGEDNEIIAILEEDLGILRSEYASMLFAAQKANNSATRLVFLFSASSFDQFIMRLRYMKQYSQLRNLQADQIIKTQNQLAAQIKGTEAKRNEKNTLLEDELTENQQLAILKTKQKALIKTLEKEEKKLRLDLIETKKAVAKLDKMIADIIREEIERAEREAREAKERATKTKTAIAETSNVLSASFEDNKNKFSWPVPGFISQKFGRQNHPVLKGIVIQNDGINIQTKKSESVRAIFNGEVRAVAFTPGIGGTVIVKHGEYFTAYSGLKDVQVKQGQKIVTHQEIGQVLSNSEGVSELRFKIYKNTTALDPQLWLH